MRKQHGDTHCELCGSRFEDEDEAIEMHKPDDPDESSICHLFCGFRWSYIITEP